MKIALLSKEEHSEAGAASSFGFFGAHLSVPQIVRKSIVPIATILKLGTRRLSNVYFGNQLRNDERAMFCLLGVVISQRAL